MLGSPARRHTKSIDPKRIESVFVGFVVGNKWIAGLPSSPLDSTSESLTFRLHCAMNRSRPDYTPARLWFVACCTLQTPEPKANLADARSQNSFLYEFRFVFSFVPLSLLSNVSASVLAVRRRSPLERPYRTKSSDSHCELCQSIGRRLPDSPLPNAPQRLRRTNAHSDCFVAEI